jgi:hypothetical protein
MHYIVTVDVNYAIERQALEDFCQHWTADGSSIDFIGERQARITIKTKRRDSRNAMMFVLSLFTGYTDLEFKQVEAKPLVEDNG